MRFPAKNKIQTINEVEEIVDNGKVKITPDDWYALVYAAYQINAIQDLVSTGFKGNAIKNISVRSGAVTSDGAPTFDFTFTYQGSDGQEVTTTATAEIPVSTIPSTPGAEGAVGPKGDSVFIKYSASADGTGFTNSWTEGQSYIGIAVAQIEPADKTRYSWTKFIDKRITGLRFNGTNLIFTWSEGPETTVTMQTSDFKTVKPVEGVVTSVDGLTGAVNIGDINTIFESDGVTAKKATNIIADENGAVNPLGRKADSAVGVNSTALGVASTASGRDSTALGRGSTASDNLSTALGAAAKALGAISTAIGYDSFAQGDYSTTIGYSSKAPSNYSTALGATANALGEDSTALGHGSSVPSTDSNTMQLGSTALSSLRCAVNLTVTSDKRDKTDIEGITDALAFLEKLNPVTFVSNNREEYISDEDKKGETFRKYGMCEYDRASHAAGTKKGERRRCGLLAQEVVEAMQSVYGTDNYANVVNDNFHDLTEKPSDVENKYTLAYANLVPFLIGAIKELSAKLKALSGAKEH